MSDAAKARHYRRSTRRLSPAQRAKARFANRRGDRFVWRRPDDVVWLYRPPAMLAAIKAAVRANRGALRGLANYD